MSDMHAEAFTEEELAYLAGGGSKPAPGSEEAQEDDGTRQKAPTEEAEAPQDQPADQQAQPDPDDADAEDADEGSSKRRAKWSSYQRVKGEREAARKVAEDLRTQLETARREQAEFRARVDQHFRTAAQSAPRQQQPQGQQEQPAAPPDLHSDPMGYIAWQNERIQRLEQGTQQSAQERQQSAQVQQLTDYYRGDNLRAAQEMPTYPEAYQFLLRQAQQEVQIQHGGQLAPHQVEQLVRQQELNLAATAHRMGKRPAELILQMAHTRGWRPQTQQPAQDQPVQNPTDEARLEAARRGQEQNRTLSGVGRSTSVNAPMTAERFANMSDNEMAEWMAKNPDGLARLNGAL